MSNNEIRRCRNEWCANSLADTDDENEPCSECQTIRAQDAAYWERVFTYDRPPTEDDLQAYAEPCEEAKRERLVRMVEER